MVYISPLRIALFAIATGLVIIAWIFSIICVATDSWLAYDLGTFEGKGNEGLWKVCRMISNSGDTTCQKIDDTFRKLHCCYFCLLMHVYFMHSYCTSMAQCSTSTIHHFNTTNNSYCYCCSHCPDQREVVHNNWTSCNCYNYRYTLVLQNK